MWGGQTIYVVGRAFIRAWTYFPIDRGAVYCPMFVLFVSSWQYRIRPTVVHNKWKKDLKNQLFTNDYNITEPNPAQVTDSTLFVVIGVLN